MRYKMILSYDGTQYAGWQIQENSTTIQEVIESALSKITQSKISITGSGRTDSGVHARGQVAHFDYDSATLSLKSLNSLLPNDIRIHSLEICEDTFHARFSAKEKIYTYHITTHKVQSPFIRKYALHHTFPLNQEKILEAIPDLLGTHDFTSFANSLLPGKDPVKTLLELEFIRESTGFILKYRGNGFLYKMVRNITGTLLDIGRGKLPPNSIPDILAAKSRAKAGKTAPPHALFLEKVIY